MTTIESRISSYVDMLNLDVSDQMKQDWAMVFAEFAKEVEKEVHNNVCDEVKDFKLANRICQFDFADVRGAKKIISV